MLPRPSPPPSPGRAAVLRKKSSSLQEQRDEVQQKVHNEVLTRKTLLARRASPYLPRSSSTSGGDAAGDLRFAASAIQTIYTIHQRYDRRRVVDNIAFIVAMMGVLLVFMDNEYANSSTAKLVVRIVNAVLTTALLVLVVWRFTLQREILVMRNVLPPHVSVFRMPRILFSLLAELVVCSIFVPPGVEGSFTVWEWKYYMDRPTLKAGCAAPFQADNGSCYMVYSYPYEVLGLLALLRLYMLPRVILNLSEFSNYRTSYLGAIHQVDTQSSLFAVKCFLQAHPFKVLLVGLVGTLFLTSYALAIVETPVNPNLVPLSNAMWLVMLTMGTVGYGDLNAVTIAGQLLLILGGMLMGILLFGVLSSAVFSALSLGERDRRFLHLLKRQAHQKRLKNACARSIQAAWRWARARSRAGDQLTRTLRANPLRDTLYARLAAQRRVRHTVIDEFRSISTELQRCQDELLASLKEDHEKTMSRLRQVEQRLDTLLVAARAAASVAA